MYTAVAEISIDSSFSNVKLIHFAKNILLEVERPSESNVEVSQSLADWLKTIPHLMNSVVNKVNHLNADILGGIITNYGVRCTAHPRTERRYVQYTKDFFEHLEDKYYEGKNFSWIFSRY